MPVVDIEREFTMGRRRFWCGLVAAGIMGATGAQAQDLTIRPHAPAPAYDTSGAMLFHGNYCGPGNRGWGVPPVDALDAACARHDACTPDHGLATCACNHRLQFEAAMISRSPRVPEDQRALAGLVSVGAAFLPCRYGT